MLMHSHASLAASCEELRARTGNPPLRFCNGSYTSVCLYSVLRRRLYNYKRVQNIFQHGRDNGVMF